MEKSPQLYGCAVHLILGGVWLGCDEGAQNHVDRAHGGTDSKYFAQHVPDSNGIYIAPAFTGFGAPCWVARGTILDLNRRANRNNITRTPLESIAYQTHGV